MNTFSPTTKLFVVGEAWGDEEAKQRRPFVGPTGRLLRSFASAAGIDLRAPEVHLTNVFNLQPKPSNSIDNLCGPKSEGIPGKLALKQGKYVLARYAPELERLRAEILEHRPNLVLALGGVALWFFTNKANITRQRGYCFMHEVEPGYEVKVLPAIHPAAIFRTGKHRVTLLADLHKAADEMHYPELQRPRRELWLNPTLTDLRAFIDRYINPAPLISADIETAQGQITHIGFAPTRDRAICVPFADPGTWESYWPTLKDEIIAFELCAGVLETKPLLGQNFLYDMNWLWSRYGVRCFGAAEDTMLLHHALEPEFEKSLLFLGSVYTSEPSWKFMRKRTTAKKED